MMRQDMLIFFIILQIEFCLINTKMKKITILILTILAFNAGAFSANNLFAEITIHGKVTSRTNQPFERADVQLGWSKIEKIQCDEDGSYKITLPDNFNEFRLVFSAVNHSQATFYIVALPNTSYEINATINPFYFKNIPDTFFVIGDFNNFSWENGIIPMNENEKGIYSATIHSENDTLAYQIFIKMQWWNSRSINGQNALFYKPDSGGDYISYVINGTKNHNDTINHNETKNHNEIKNYNVVFDINQFLTEYPEPELTSSNPAINEFLKFDKISDKLIDESYIIMGSVVGDENAENMLNNIETENQASGINSKKEEHIEHAPELIIASLDSVKRVYAEKIDSLFHKAQYKETKIVLMSRYFNVLWVYHTPHDLSFAENTDIINFCLDSVDINSVDWESYFMSCIIAGESLTSSARIENFLQARKETDENAWAYYRIIDYAMRKGDTVNAKRYFARMKEEFPESKYTKDMINHYNLDSSKEIKTMIPDFELADLDNKSATISMQSLRGKYILIDFWGTWCHPCIMDMPHLEAAYERFKDKNFIIYSIAKDKEENIEKFRNRKYKMPWLHSILDKTVEKLLEIEGYPTQILVSPDGEILARHIGNIGNKLEVILERYLK